MINVGNDVLVVSGALTGRYGVVHEKDAAGSEKYLTYRVYMPDKEEYYWYGEDEITPLPVGVQSELATLRAEIETLRRERDELRAALTPFADFFEGFIMNSAADDEFRDWVYNH